MKIESLTRCKRLAATAAFLVILCSDPAAAQADAAEANGVWRDQAHGMTLALPAGCQAQKEIPPGTVREHADLCEAIKARDVELARKLIVAHHWNIEQRFRKVLELELLSSGSS